MSYVLVPVMVQGEFLYYATPADVDGKISKYNADVMKLPLRFERIVTRTPVIVAYVVDGNGRIWTYQKKGIDYEERCFVSYCLRDSVSYIWSNDPKALIQSPAKLLPAIGVEDERPEAGYYEEVAEYFRRRAVILN